MLTGEAWPPAGGGRSMELAPLHPGGYILWLPLGIWICNMELPEGREENSLPAWLGAAVLPGRCGGLAAEVPTLVGLHLPLGSRDREAG